MAGKSRRALVIGLAIVGAIVGVTIAAVLSLNAFTWSCRYDDEIAADQRAAIGAVALDFVQRATGPDPTATYELMTASTRQSAPPADKLAAYYRERMEKVGPVQDWRVTHTYVVKLTGITNDLQAASCGNTSSPAGRVLVAVKGGAEQAHVLVEGDSPHNRMVFALWMEMEGGRWRLIEQYIRAVTYLGKGATDFEEMAKVEQRDQHPLNAALLYSQAQALADRGPRFQLGIASRLVEGFRTVAVPPPLAGEPPFAWNADGEQFRVLSVAPGAFDDDKGRNRLWIVVTHELDPWTDNAVPERKNRALSAAFRKAYPSYKRQFAGLVIRAREKTNGPTFNIWGTVLQDDGDAPNDGHGSTLVP